jgi:menaquinone-dependent protoporphyrinogen oxidase
MPSANAQRILVIHGGRFGQSTKIARTVADTLESAGFDVDFQELTSKTTPDPSIHAALVLVTSVRYGYFDKNAYKLVAKNRAWIDSVPSLLITVSLTARKPEKRDPEVHSYTKKFLDKSGWQPGHVEVVAGRLEYPRYNWFDTMMIQLIMRMTGGETDKTKDIEYTDWDQVDRTAKDFVAVLSDPQA